MILLISFLNFFIPLSSWHAMEVHPIHASVCELKYNEEAAAFQVSIKIYIDDLETAMKKEGYPQVNLGAKQVDELSLEYLASYLDKYFSITLDGKKLPATLDGKELSDDFLAVWCYIQFPAHVAKGQKCTISNRVLLDLYSDQRNIMDIKMSKTQKEYTIFDPSNSSWSYTY